MAHDEARRIATQLTRSVRGPAWHGPSLKTALAGVTARQATLRPIPQAHSIWEIAGHAAAWIRIVRLRIEGRGPKSVPKAINFPAPRRGTAGECRKVLAGVRRESARLALVKQQIKALEAARRKSLEDGKQPMVAQLAKLRAIGPKGAWVLVKELFGKDH